MYDIILSDLAKKQLGKLPQQLRDRVGIVLERIRVRPHHFAVRLVGSPYFRVRVGDYRIIIDISQEKLVVLVIEVGHRKNIYD